MLKRIINALKKVKSGYIILIALLIAAALIPLAVMYFSSRPEKTQAIQQIEAGGIQYSYREYLVGCIMDKLAFLNSAPSENDMEGIYAVGSAVNSSLHYLVQTDRLQGGGLFSLEYMPEDKRNEHFGNELKQYLNAAEKAADYALKTEITYNGSGVFLPVCRISSGALIETPDMPWVKKLYCPRDKSAVYYSGGCQLTSNGIAEILLSDFSGLILSPDESEWITDIICDENKNVLSLNVCGIKMSGFEFRRMFEIRSVCFEMTYSQGLYSFKTKGDGDSTGMSVFAAVELSKSGYTAPDILDTFYDIDIKYL